MKFFKVFLTLLISIACVGTVSVQAEEQERYHTGYRRFDHDFNHKKSHFKSYSAKGHTFDSSYDPREKGMISPIKDQQYTETCWAYATVAMAESNLIKQGLADNTVDLSEHHLAYFLYHSSNDPLKNTDGDRTIIGDGMNYLSGGNVYIALEFLSGYSGLVKENVVSPMPDSLDKAEVIDPEFQYNHNSYTLKNVYYADNDIDTIKELINNYGAVSIAYEYSLNENTMNFEHNSIYNPEGNIKASNHVVTLVGWDDNYSKDNFTLKPENDGAWLMKNSWGKIGSEDGYFWISYEEPSICEVVSAEFEKATYQYNYHYDGGLSIDCINCENEMKVANVFKVKGNQTGNDEILKAVNMAIGTDNTEYSIDIYRNVTYGEDPTDGILVTNEPITGKIKYAGHYTVELENPITLAQNDYYSIVVTARKNNDYVGFMVEYDQEAEWIQLQCGLNENQSFFYENGQWVDLFDEGKTARIKGLTVNGQTKSTLKLDIPVSKTLTVGEQYQFLTTSTDLIWKSSNTNIVKVDSNGKIEALTQGQATITITTDYGIVYTCVITVNKKPVIEDEKQIPPKKNNSNLKNNNIINLNHKNLKGSVNTSDNVQLEIWLGIMVIALVGVLIFVRKDKSKKRNKH